MCNVCACVYTYTCHECIHTHHEYVHTHHTYIFIRKYAAYIILYVFEVYSMCDICICVCIYTHHEYIFIHIYAPCIYIDTYSSYIYEIYRILYAFNIYGTSHSTSLRCTWVHQSSARYQIESALIYPIHFLCLWGAFYVQHIYICVNIYAPWMYSYTYTHHTDTFIRVCSIFIIHHSIYNTLFFIYNTSHAICILSVWT